VWGDGIPPSPATSMQSLHAHDCNPHGAAYNSNMAKAKSLDAKIDALARVAESGFSLMENGFSAVSEDIALRPTATTVGILLTTLLDEQLQPISRELRIIRVELDHLREKVENIIGFRVEIDHALERIAAIEKHLGINKKIAA